MAYCRFSVCLCGVVGRSVFPGAEVEVRRWTEEISKEEDIGETLITSSAPPLMVTLQRGKMMGLQLEIKCRLKILCGNSEALRIILILLAVDK